MALTFEQLTALLTPTDGGLTLDPETLEADAVTRLFAAVLKGGVLDLSEAQSTPDAASSTIAVTGTLAEASFLDAASATVTEGRFTLDADGSVSVLLTIAVGDDSWTPAAAFPVLKGTVFDSLSWDSPVFTLDSTASTVLPSDFRALFGYPDDAAAVVDGTVRGLSLAVSVHFVDLLDVILSPLFTLPVALSGPIEVYRTGGDSPTLYPQLRLAPASGCGVAQGIGSYTFTFEPVLACVLGELEGDDGAVAVIANPLIALSSSFGAPTLTPAIPMLATLSTGSIPAIRLNVGGPPGNDLTPSQLPSLLNGCDPGALLTPGFGFPVLDALTLDNVTVGIRLSPVSLSDVAVRIGLGEGKNWSIFGGLVTFSGIGIVIQATNSQGTFTPQATVFSSATLFGNDAVALDAYVSLPSLAFECTLTSQVTLDLTQAVTNLIGASIPLPAFTGGTFAIRGDVSASSYQFDASIQQTWNLIGSGGGLTIGDMQISLSYDKAAGVSGLVGGSLTLAGVAIEVAAAYLGKDAGWSFFGGSAPGQTINLSALFADIVRLFGVDEPPELPEVDLDSLSLSYDTKTGDFSVTAIVAVPGLSVNLTDLPIVGKYLGPDDSIALKSLTFDVKKADGAASVDLVLSIAFGASLKQLVIPIKKPKAVEPKAGEPPAERSTALVAAGTAAGTSSYPPSGSGTWIDVQRSFGPLTVQRIGFSIGKSGLGIAFNASLTLSSLQITVLGLGTTMPLSGSFTPSFSIDSLQVAIKAGSIKIGGGLYRIANPNYLQFDGNLNVQCGSLSLTAFGSYATTADPSMFAFIVADLTIGGPPPFFITGLSGGFGYNRSLTLPSITDVTEYPLILGASPGTDNPFGANADLGAFLEVMDTYIGVEMGEQWLAAGINFTSFGMVDSQAVLSVAFGNRLQIALLGRSLLNVPSRGPCAGLIGRAELVLKAVIAPDDGVVSVEAQLTANSYVLSKDCHLTGGFAFYVWFSPNEHSGDFVLSLGGYHPRYEPPPHYPAVPRLGFNWQVIPQLAMKGEIYFALTSHAIMAGGLFDARFEAGPIKAWFTVYADFLLQWLPLHYDIAMGVNFGVAVVLDTGLFTLKISVSVGAELLLMGPSFAGRATIDIVVLSFTISFGELSTKQPVSWSDFKTLLDNKSSSSETATLLLAAGEEKATPTTTIIAPTVSEGLRQDLRSSKEVDYIVDPQTFELTVSLMIPAVRVRINDGAWTECDNTDFGIGPMLLDAFTSDVTLLVTRGDEQEIYDEIAVARKTCNAPKAMWWAEKDLDAALNEPEMLDDITMTLVVTPNPPQPNHTMPVKVPVLLYDVSAILRLSWGAPDVPATDPYAGQDPVQSLTSTIADAGVAQTRAVIASALGDLGFALPSVIDTTAMADPDTLKLLCPVTLAPLGQNTAAAVQETHRNRVMASTDVQITATTRTDMTGVITFYDFFDPPMKSGDYRVAITHHAAGGSGDKAFDETFANALSFNVQGVRFAIDADTVVTQFPAPDAMGEYSNVLPHIVFNVETLPWQRDPGDRAHQASPWLALLLFDVADPAPPLVAGTLKDLMADGLPAGTVSYEGLSLEVGQAAGDAISYIDVPVALWNAIAPTEDDLIWLAHARTLAPDATTHKTIDLDGEPPDERFSVVVANRLPTPGNKSVCCLVSVENMHTRLPGAGQALPEGTTTIRLASLSRWSFGCEPVARTFADILASLDVSPSTLQVPISAEAAEKAKEKTGFDVGNALAMGFCAFPHHTRQGSDTLSWYRGPLLPYANPKQLTGPFPAADSLLRYDPATGMFDVSYAAAWQLGQLLALNDRNFATTLYSWKQTNRQSAVAGVERAVLGAQINVPLAAAEPVQVQVMRDAVTSVLSALLAKKD